MVSIENEEEAAIAGLVTCLAIALRQSSEYTPDELGETVVQKLVYLGAQEFDLKITYSWYLAGSYVEGVQDGASQVQTAFDNLPKPSTPGADDTRPQPESPITDEPDDDTSLPASDPDDIQMERSIEDLQNSYAEPDLDSTAGGIETPGPEQPFGPDWFEDATDSELPDEFNVSGEDVVTFYERLLGQYTLHPTDRFLKQFYEYNTPTEYAALYEHCLDLRSVLRKVVEEIKTALEGQQSTVDFTRQREEFGRALSEFHLELYATDTVAETASTVIEATEPIEEMLIALTTKDRDELTETHLSVAEDVQEFFYYTVWRYPALKISMETATGPNAEEVITERHDTYDGFETTVREATESLRERLATVGLRPAPEEFPNMDDETTQAIGDLISAYQNRSG
jgi:hypothetical protein